MEYGQRILIELADGMVEAFFRHDYGSSFTAVLKNETEVKLFGIKSLVGEIDEE